MRKINPLLFLGIFFILALIVTVTYAVTPPLDTPPPCPAGSTTCPNPFETWLNKATLKRVLDNSSDAFLFTQTTKIGGSLTIGGLETTTLKVTDGKSAGKVLTSDVNGNATWQATQNELQTGTSGQTLRSNGTSWITNNAIKSDGTNVTIGGTSGNSNKLFLTSDSNAHYLRAKDWWVDVVGNQNEVFRVFGGANGASEYLRVTGDGKVGIGTESPEGIFEVVSQSFEYQKIGNPESDTHTPRCRCDTSDGGVYYEGGRSYLNSGFDCPSSFATADAEGSICYDQGKAGRSSRRGYRTSPLSQKYHSVKRISSRLMVDLNGGVGIGTTTFMTGEKLAVSDGTTQFGIYPGYKDGTANADWVTMDIPGGKNLRVWDNFSVAGTFESNDATTNGTLTVKNGTLTVKSDTGTMDMSISGTSGVIDPNGALTEIKIWDKLNVDGQLCLSGVCRTTWPETGISGLTEVKDGLWKNDKIFDLDGRSTIGGPFNVSGDVGITGNLEVGGSIWKGTYYLRVDSDSVLRRVLADEFCIGGVCKTGWPSSGTTINSGTDLVARSYTFGTNTSNILQESYGIVARLADGDGSHAFRVKNSSGQEVFMVGSAGKTIVRSPRGAEFVFEEVAWNGGEDSYGGWYGSEDDVDTCDGDGNHEFSCGNWDKKDQCIDNTCAGIFGGCRTTDTTYRWRYVTCKIRSQIRTSNPENVY